MGKTSRLLKGSAAVGLAAAALTVGGVSPAAANPGWPFTDLFSIVNDVRDECLDGLGEGDYAQVDFCDQGQGQYWAHVRHGSGPNNEVKLVNPRMNGQLYCLLPTEEIDGALLRADPCNFNIYRFEWTIRYMPGTAEAVKYIWTDSQRESRWKCLGRRGAEAVLEYCSTANTQLWRYR
ncbi:hypothetical protein [Actinocorallia sp. A-T 12471]|uniref:hypothetical protein n=1 Tax=Actinocorallia sp. A-T 12471 TaxID=3089813 RepID=UPI0029D131D9|nr:hypothetical protein [Actinocorallia sp. A-T 12471]MDX6741446.1 hypothetical protein [Actinocorallia sp. A-T 12471]